MQRLIAINSPLFMSSPQLDELPSWQSVFGNDNPLALEIGCGVGDFAVQMAQQHPDWNFIALDFYNKGCLKSCSRAERHGLTNIRVVRDEARSFLRRCIAPHSLRALYINCPDPWPKRYQRKRRLVNQEFIPFIATYLNRGADFYFATDFDDYGIDVAKLMAAQPGFVNVLAPDLWRHELEQYPQSKYMRRFISEGKAIYFIHYRTLPEEREDRGE